ncbi:hypothetical protein ABWK50_09855, partial [Priestia megaterium]|uniref:hypothetical protein n=1 Tax=Priestia megaterium TaxID=1404 RepID=UPI003391EDA5
EKEVKNVKHMLIVCNQHVKEGLIGLKTPHVKKIHYSTCTCSFCERRAKIKIFYSIPQKYSKTNFYVSLSMSRHKTE